MKIYNSLVKSFLSELVGKLRYDLNISQEKMSEYLRISARAYGDLERGRFCFSATSLLFLMVALDEKDVLKLIADFKMLIDKAESVENENTDIKGDKSG